jgi:acyl carrier protein
MDSAPKTPSEAFPSKQAIQHWLQLRIAEGLQVAAEEIDATAPFSCYGLDSVAAFGILSELEIWLGRKLPHTMTWDYSNIELLSAFLAEGQEVGGRAP